MAVFLNKSSQYMLYNVTFAPEKGGVVDFLTLLNGNKQRVLVGDVTESGKSVITLRRKNAYDKS